MTHLSDGTLRRLCDEPLALGARDRAHYDSCGRCRSRFAAVAADARYTATVLAVEDADLDPQAALARLGQRLEAVPPAGRMTRLRAALGARPGGLGWRRPAAAAALVVGLAAVTAFTPFVQTLVQVFEPSQLQPVTVGEPTQGDLSALQSFSRWGDVKWTRQASLQQVGSAAEAARVSGLPQLTLDPSQLPKGFAGASATPPWARPWSPRVTSTGASVSEIKSALLASDPNLSPSLRALIGGLDSPTGNLPIPIPADRASARMVAVWGLTATALGDNTGLGAGVVWVDPRTHRVFAVAGTLGVDEAVGLANRLKLA